MRNLILFLLAVLGWWYFSNPSTQAMVSADGNLEYPGYRIESVEPFSIEARVLSRENYSFGRESDLSPTDLALGWGPMADKKVLAEFRISQGNRWFHWEADQMPISRSEITNNSTNMHLIPASESAAADLARVDTDDRIRLHGKLVDVSAEDGWHWRTSRSRSDTGKGACELLWLERIDWL